MPREDEDAAMRAQLALLELEEVEVDNTGQILNKPYEAHRLKVSGLTWKQIAKKLGYANESAAHRAAKIYLQTESVHLSAQQRAEAVNMALTRLEAQLHQYWQPALLGDIAAAQLVLKYIQEINKLLGLYEGQENKMVERFVVIQRETDAYASKLKQIALGQEDPKQLTPTIEGHPEVQDG